MLRAFSTAATGMDAQQTMVDVIANNLANVNTNGFKTSTVNFQDLLYVKLREAGREVASGITAPSGLEVGSGVRLASTNKIFTVGEFQSTGNDLHLAIQGDGFLKVTLPNGDLRYTRDGALQMDANGQLVTASGFVISPAITIPQDFRTIDIAADGTVSVETSSGNQAVGNIELYRFQNPAGLASEGGNLYRETESSGAAASGTPGEDGYGSILSKYLEKSNVQMVSELVNLIQAQRGYEINSRCIRVGDNMLQQLSTLVR
ncbi:MAG: flagellar basal-body rod protein FlgG [Sedimentisphaerales bacterium]|nr:flagellar basal-body rod protein FlgG [Sedimentisphaerales bacterium]